MLHGFRGNLVCFALFLGKCLLDQFFAPERGEIIIADLLRRAPPLAFQGCLHDCDLALDFLNLWIIFGKRGGELRVLSLKVRKPLSQVLQQMIVEHARQ